MISREGKKVSWWNFGHCIDTVLNKEHAENVHQMLVPDPFFILVNNPKKPLDAILLKMRYFESKGDYQKPFKK